MTTNLGTLDRSLRAALGVVLLLIAVFSDATPVIFAAAVIGLIMLATATLKFCPIYTLFGLKTCRDC